ncbi:MAG: ABC1 kinase family protein [Raoultibacter sp.]|jgi:ubiquinone biosynthesis protein
MPTFREFLRVARITTKDTTSGKRMREIRRVLKQHKAFDGLTPDKATAILEDLGPTFVKMGQIASNRSDVLPKEYCDAFEKLRTDVPPLPFETIIELLEKTYGCSWNEVFAVIEEQPLGSASIAQVHKALLHDGSAVAVKVRRPGIVQKMAEDITLMKHVLALAEFSVSASHNSLIFSVDNLISELEHTTAEEINFAIELENLIRFKSNNLSQKGISSPLPYSQYSTEKVLVMEFVTGILVNDREKLEEAQIDLCDLGTRLAESYTTQVIDQGFFHADPHPGNIVVSGKEIVWLDLGMTGTLSVTERALVSKIFTSVASHNAFELKESLLSLTKEIGPVDHSRLLEQIDSLLTSYASVNLAELNVGMAFLDIIEVLRTQNLSLPPSFTMLARGFVTIEGVLAELAPEISVVEIVSQHVEKQMKNRAYIEGKAKDFLYTGISSFESATRLPQQASNTLDMLARGELKVNADMNFNNDVLASIYTASGRLSLALISAGLFLGSSILCTTEMEPQLLGVPVVGFFGYVGAFVLSVYVIWQTFSSRHKQRNNLKLH